MTSSTFKKGRNCSIRKEHANEMSVMTKKIEELEAMVKFVVKKQNPELEEDNINNTMTRVLSKEISGMGLHSSASTHDPHYEHAYLTKTCLLGFKICFQVTHGTAFICNVGGVHIKVIASSLSFFFFAWILEI